MTVPLLVSSDDALHAELARLVGSLDARGPGHAVRSAWIAAPVVLVGLDALVALTEAGLPRRDRVLLVAVVDPTPRQWQSALDLGVSAVVTIPGDERMLVDLVAGPAGDPSSTCRVIGLVAGSGGAGASTTAAALAAVACGTTATVLVDADPYAGGLDVLLGAEDQPGLRWRDLTATDRRVDPTGFEPALVTAGGFRLLSYGFGELCCPSAATASAALNAARRSFELIVVDLPRVLDPAAEVWLAATELVVVVVAPTVRSVAAASTVSGALSNRGARVAVAVRHGDAATLSTADVSAGLGVPVIGRIRSEASVALAADHGRPPVGGPGRPRRRRTGSLERFCTDLLSPPSVQAAA